MQPVEWHWKGWLAYGKFHVLAGGKAAGKSTIGFDLMAKTTSAGEFPDGTPAPLGDVIVWSGEDSIEDTILPRFVAAGGDLKRIYPIKHVLLPHGGCRAFGPSTDLQDLAELVDKVAAPRILMIDPVVLAIPAKTDVTKHPPRLATACRPSSTGKSLLRRAIYQRNRRSGPGRADPRIIGLLAPSRASFWEHLPTKTASAPAHAISSNVGNRRRDPNTQCFNRRS
jgi:hypothetical protein